MTFALDDNFQEVAATLEVEAREIDEHCSGYELMRTDADDRRGESKSARTIGSVSSTTTTAFTTSTTLCGRVFHTCEVVVSVSSPSPLSLVEIEGVGFGMGSCTPAAPVADVFEIDSASGDVRLDIGIVEECDDGNSVSNDGCSPGCMLERF